MYLKKMYRKEDNLYFLEYVRGVLKRYLMVLNVSV